MTERFRRETERLTVDARRQAALVEFGLDLIGVKRRDAERDVTHRGPAPWRRGGGFTVSFSVGMRERSNPD